MLSDNTVCVSNWSNMFRPKWRHLHALEPTETQRGRQNKITFYSVLWPIKAQLFHKLSHCYMFRHSRVILRELVINAFNTCSVHLLLFCSMTNKCTIISQIITLLHVSTLSCHPQGANNQCFQYPYRAFSIILCYDQ